MSCNSERPLVTLLLLTFNQEKYVEDSIQGALSQSYTPLEIIISDDCSSDNTFGMIKKCVSDYSGPHSIRIIQNAQNLGIGMHINKLMENAEGQLVVASAGDDISLPDRVETLVNAWLEGDCAADMLHSQVMQMNQDGHVLNDNFSANYHCTNAEDFIKSNVIIGASEAWTKRLFDRFGPLNPDVVHEDRTIGFRALLGGGITFVNKPLVKYRTGGISQFAYISCREVLYDIRSVAHKRYTADCRQNLADLQTLYPDATMQHQLKVTVANRIKYHEARYLLATRNSISSVITRFSLLHDPRLMIAVLQYLFPWACKTALWLRGRLRRALKG